MKRTLFGRPHQKHHQHLKHLQQPKKPKLLIWCFFAKKDSYIIFQFFDKTWEITLKGTAGLLILGLDVKRICWSPWDKSWLTWFDDLDGTKIVAKNLYNEVCRNLKQLAQILKVLFKTSMVLKNLIENHYTNSISKTMKIPLKIHKENIIYNHVAKVQKFFMESLPKNPKTFGWNSKVFSQNL